MKVGWQAATVDFDELVALIADGFCLANGIDRTKHRVRVGLRADSQRQTFSATVEWREATT